MKRLGKYIDQKWVKRHLTKLNRQYKLEESEAWAGIEDLETIFKVHMPAFWKMIQCSGGEGERFVFSNTIFIGKKNRSFLSVYMRQSVRRLTSSI